MRGISIPNFIKIGSKVNKLCGSKVFKKGQKYEKNWKNYWFFLITFLFLMNYYIMKIINKSAWYLEPACQISLENIENWQSYSGLKFWKGCFYCLFSRWKTREITNKNSLFITSNLDNFVSFQYFPMKFGMYVPDIKQSFLFS